MNFNSNIKFNIKFESKYISLYFIKRLKKYIYTFIYTNTIISLKNINTADGKTQLNLTVYNKSLFYEMLFN